jgi:molybdopterin-binding protein
MKISARNVLKGKVKSVVRDSVDSEITLELSGGMEVVSIISTKSADNLKLKVGDEVYAVVKATSVMIATD